MELKKRENCVKSDIREKGLRGDEWKDRAGWKMLTKNAEPV